MSEVKSVVHEVLLDIADEEGLEVTEIQGDEKLVEDLGFRSLVMARILAILEERLRVDPFSQQVAVTSVRTVDDLCHAYEQCLAGQAADQPADALEEGRQRAEARRRAARSRSAN